MSRTHLLGDPPAGELSLAFTSLFAHLRAAKATTHVVVAECAPGSVLCRQALDDYFGACRDTLSVVDELVRDWTPIGKAH